MSLDMVYYRTLWHHLIHIADSWKKLLLLFLLYYILSICFSKKHIINWNQIHTHKKEMQKPYHLYSLMLICIHLSFFSSFELYLKVYFKFYGSKKQETIRSPLLSVQRFESHHIPPIAKPDHKQTIVQVRRKSSKDNYQ